MPGRAGVTRRKDGNHDDIVEACRRIPAEVLSTAHVGNGFPDVLVCYRDVVVLLEVKRPGQGLTAKEAAFALRWPVKVVETPEQAVMAVVEAARVTQLAYRPPVVFSTSADPLEAERIVTEGKP